MSVNSFEQATTTIRIASGGLEGRQIDNNLKNKQNSRVAVVLLLVVQQGRKKKERKKGDEMKPRSDRFGAAKTSVAAAKLSFFLGVRK